MQIYSDFDAFYLEKETSSRGFKQKIRRDNVVLFNPPVDVEDQLEGKYILYNI